MVVPSTPHINLLSQPTNPKASTPLPNPSFLLSIPLQTNKMAQMNGETVPVAQEKINTDIVTLTRFLTEEQSKHREATGDFTCVPPSPVGRLRCLLLYADFSM